MTEPVSTAPDLRLARPAARIVLFIGLIAVFARAGWHYSSSVLNHDVSWLLVAARRLLEGGRFGSEIYELNLPGAVLIYLPAAWLAKVSGAAVGVVLVGYVLALLALCLCLAGWALRQELGAGRATISLAFLLHAAAVLLAVPGIDFGQREHLIAILLMPFCLTHASAGGDGSGRAILQVGAAALAAIAICIKPTYAPLPLLLLVIQCRRRGVRPVLRSVAARIFLAIGAIYLAAIFWLFPEWLGIARRAWSLYGAFSSADELGANLAGLLWWAAPLLLVIAAVNWRCNRRHQPVLHRFVNALLALAALALLLLLAWGPGWTYHQLPVKLALGLAAGALLVSAARWREATWLEPVLTLALALTATASTLFLMTPARVFPKQLFRQTGMARVIGRAAQPPVVSFFAMSLPPAFPLVTELGLDWGSRFPHLWPLAGIRHQEQLLDTGGRASLDEPELRALETELIAMIVADLERYRPSLVVVDEREQKQGVRGELDILERFSRHPEFRRAWLPYRRVAVFSGPYAMYQRMPVGQ